MANVQQTSGRRAAEIAAHGEYSENWRVQLPRHTSALGTTALRPFDTDSAAVTEDYELAFGSPTWEKESIIELPQVSPEIWLDQESPDVSALGDIELEIVVDDDDWLLAGDYDELSNAPVILVRPINRATNDQTWRHDAVCTEQYPEIFYPPIGSTTFAAKYICALCKVQNECLVEAISSETNYRFGVWGGMSPNEREKYAELTTAGDTEQATSYRVKVRTEGAKRASSLLQTGRGLTAGLDSLEDA